MTDKQIKLDGSFIPIEEAIKAGLVSENDIDVPSKRLDRIDKMEIDLANYEQMERDIEKIIEPYQLDWELDCLSLPSAIKSILERKEQECERLKHDNDYEVGALERTIENLKAENKHLNDLLNQALKDYEKAMQTLTEIKEIANREAESSRYNGSSTWKQILQKISECEVE